MKTKSFKRVRRIVPALVLALVMVFSAVPTIPASAAGDDIFYMTVSGTLRYDYANEVANLTNQQRVANGQTPLQMDPELTERAMLRAREITRVFSHTRPNGESYYSVLGGSRFASSASGENIAYGTAWFFTPSMVVTSWMNSEGHRANILRSGYQSIGVGAAIDASTGNAFYVQIFSVQPASGQGVYNGTVEYGTCIEGSFNSVDFNDLMGPSDIYYGFSPVFDADYYMNTYSDIYEICGGFDKGNAFAHFITNGMAEGRRGNEEFDPVSYRLQYADLRAAFGNDYTQYYLHYANYGKAEGRQGSGCTTLQGGITTYQGVDYSAVYDYNTYIKKNPDIQEAYPNDDVSTLAHFVNYGMAEGRSASDSFDVYSYKNANADLRAAFGNDLRQYYLHYMNYGRKEGRRATNCPTLMNPITSLNGVDYSAVYDYNYYTSHNGDVAAKYGNDDVAVLQHFIQFGMSEGRQAKDNFNVNSYRNQYADLRAAFGYDLAAYYRHFMTNGQKEGRVGTGSENTLQGAVTSYNGKDYSAVYNYNYYVSHNRDVAAAYGNDDIAILAHFVNYGMAEGRQASASFNVNVYRDRYGDLQQAFGNDLKAYSTHYIDNGVREGRSGI